MKLCTITNKWVTTLQRKLRMWSSLDDRSSVPWTQEWLDSMATGWSRKCYNVTLLNVTLTYGRSILLCSYDSPLDFLYIFVVVIIVEEVTFFAFQRHDANRERHDTVYEKVSAILTISLPIAPTWNLKYSQYRQTNSTPWKYFSVAFIWLVTRYGFIHRLSWALLGSFCACQN